MKTIDYSPNVENKLVVVNYYNSGTFKLFIDGLLIFNSDQILRNYFNHVAFSHDGSKILFTEHTRYVEVLKITPLYQIQQNNIDQGSIFRFTTDDRILNYIVSTNSDQVAILFKCSNYYINSITGVTNINRLNLMDNFLNVYDFANNRLLFQQIYERNIKFSISEINTIAVSKHHLDDYEGIPHYEIAIFDLINGNRLNNIFYEYEILFIQYFPEIEPYYNRLLVITREQGNIQNMKILELENNFRQIYNKDLSEYRINTVSVTRNRQIAVGTTNGVIYFPSLDEDQIPEMLFYRTNIINIIFSQSGNKIKVESSEYHDITDENYIEIYEDSNLLGIHDDVPDEDLAEIEIYRVPTPPPELDIEIEDPDLDIVIPTAPTDTIKLSENENKSCFDPMQVSEANIGQYLSSDIDNLVIFYQELGAVDFFATCLSFTTLKIFLKDPKMIFYACVPGKDFRTYCHEPPQFLKIPGSHTIFVDYQDIKQKYMQRQNMIFVVNSFCVAKTITYDASYFMRFISSNHCQEGSIINVYRIIF
jgi:hypothetical protein